MIGEILTSYSATHFYYTDKYFCTYYTWDRVNKRVVNSKKGHVRGVRCTAVLHFAYVAAQFCAIAVNSSHPLMERWTGALIALTYLFELGFRAEWNADPRVLELVNGVLQSYRRHQDGNGNINMYVRI